MDTFGSTISRKKSTVGSRSSTIGTSSSGTMSSHDKRSSRMAVISASSPPPSTSSPDEGAHVHVDRSVHTSDNGLNSATTDDPLDEQLNLARKNSRSMAMMSPNPAHKLGSKSVAELRGQVEERAELERKKSLSTKSAVDLRGRRRMDADPLALAEARRSGSPTPLSPTAPLRVRNRSASPARTLDLENDAPKPPPKDGVQSVASPTVPNTPSLDTLASHGHTPSISAVVSTFEPAARVPSPSPRPQSPPQPQTPHTPSSLPPLTIPDRVASPSIRGPVPLALNSLSRPLGPRSPGARPLPSTPVGIGSAHTKLRVVSGNGRKVSLGREMVPLKTGDENLAPVPQPTPPSPPAPAVISKRPHDVDQTTPRKRSPTRSPLQPRVSVAGDEKFESSPRIPSGGFRAAQAQNQARRLSGHSGYSTPRKISASRRASGAHSIVSQHTGGSVVEISSPIVPQVPQVPKNVPSALESLKQKLVDSRAGVKKLKHDVHVMRKQIGAEAPRPVSVIGNGSLPRSPHRRNISVSVLASP